MTDSSFPPPTYCVNHPKREATLRCNRCDNPICTECAVLTPTGYRCKDCVRSQQKIFDTAKPIDFVLAIIVALVLSYLGSLIASVMGFFTLFIAPIAGVVIAEAIRWVIHRRRSRILFQMAAVAAVLGSLPRLLVTIFGIIAYSSLSSGQGAGVGSFGISALLGLLWPAVYTFFVASTVYYRLRGIQIR